ncbi:MAG: C39 family peptidase [Chloroflexi bacterium]|nr:C39 family peptidase [Chloroflexota bacterium]
MSPPGDTALAATVLTSTPRSARPAMRGASVPGRALRGVTRPDVSFVRALALVARRELARSAGGPTVRAREPIVAVSQSDPAEYASSAQFREWSGSSCSAAALTSVLRASGVPARVADVLRALGNGITPSLGLVSRPALVAAARQFGLAARDDVTSYQALQRAVASGQPVLVDVTNSRFPEGHWLVVTGAGASGVTVADSSGFRLRAMGRDELMASWSGHGVRLGAPSATRLGPAERWRP